MSSGPLRDYDFHPDEDEVRVFAVGPGGVLRLDEQACVYAVRYGDVVLWHYAFARHWFKVNLTTDLTGRIVETAGEDPGVRFAFNCDLATPMRRQHHEDPPDRLAFNCDVATPMRRQHHENPPDRLAFNCDGTPPMHRQLDAVFAVDLFADVLVRADAVTYRVGDLDEFGQARRAGLILPGEADGAERGLAELTGLVDRGELLAFLSRAWPIGPLEPPAAVPPDRVRLDQVPLLSRDNRAAWWPRSP